MEIPIKKELNNAKNIFLCGAGGGFDIYSGIPLYFYLKNLGKNVILGNYSFSALSISNGEKIGKTGWKITPSAREIGYFPEKFLSEWFHLQGETVEIIGFQKSGVVPLQQTYQTIIETYDIDTFILVDGGTDSLMRGDETGLGTPIEDMTSIVAASKLSLSRKYLIAIGFGIDHFHGVCHKQFLESVAIQIKNGGYKGCCSVTKEDEEGEKFMELVGFANHRQKGHQSIVANSIVSAMEGQFGNYHATPRTRGSKLFINPLMNIYWFFDLDKVAGQLLYLSLIEDAQTEHEVRDGIWVFRDLVKPKKWEDMPL